MKFLPRVIGLLLLSAAGCCPGSEAIVNDDFLNDLGSENSRIAATLYLDVHPEGLQGVTYDEYLTYLASHEAPSAQGLKDRICKADAQYFRTAGKKFLLMLYYTSESRFVADVSRTSYLDTVLTVTAPLDTALVGRLVRKYGF